MQYARRQDFLKRLRIREILDSKKRNVLDSFISIPICIIIDNPPFRVG